ncbi:hypothetical protein BKA70DRAFT_1120122, partial [Coprinopsis sp. MPI-PUGE-AT-0042]
ECLSKMWRSSVYAFFEHQPTRGTDDSGRPYHEFMCTALHCKANSRMVRCYLDKEDHSSTGNMSKHTKKCWGEKIVDEAKDTPTLTAARDGLKSAKMKDGQITAIFERQGKGEVSFSTMPLTYEETRVTCVCWCTESMRPLTVIDDPMFHKLMKPHCSQVRLPKSRTMRRDTHVVFRAAKARVVQLLKVC